MAGIYIHIPFCSKACHYCNFHFSTSLHRKDEFLKALAIEIAHQPHPSDVALTTAIDTVYFGGGTPSLLSAGELDAILQQLNGSFTIAQDAEITLEANPDDISVQKLKEWKTQGINRLSIGIQSFADADLKWMNRAHTATQSRQCLQLAREHGFESLNIDLIYGLPHASIQQWQDNVEEALALQIPHLSCYALTVEEKTALQYFIRKGKVLPPSDEYQAACFMFLMQCLEKNGYEHYEISNFALPGYRSRHNSSYWQGKPYYGFGPSAHSYDGKNTRWWNIANNAFYITQLSNGLPAFESETLNLSQRINETIMTRLRMAEGLTLQPDDLMLEGFALSAEQWGHIWPTLQQGIQNGWLMTDAQSIRLTNTGKLYADHIASGLFVD